MKICIIKLGADGDVIRTLPLAKALKNKFAGADITWITKGDVASLIKTSYVDSIRTIPYSSTETFDILYNFDIEPAATALAENITAKQKFGFSQESGYPVALNAGAHHYLNTVFDDEVKKSNRKTYQELMFEAAELPYHRQHASISLSSEDKAYAATFAKTHTLGKKKVIGIHMGASARWPSKVWHQDNLKEFIRLAKEKYDILLFAGPNEVKKHSLLATELARLGVQIVHNDPHNTKRQFAALVSLCDAIVCSDSFALHVALALQKKTVGLFFCTSPHEVEGYTFLRKVVSPFFEDFFPQRMDEYSEELTKSISASEVLQEIDSLVALSTRHKKPVGKV